MNSNTLLWIAIIAFLVFCCGPMLFMRRHGRRPHDAPKEDAPKEKDWDSGKQ